MCQDPDVARMAAALRAPSLKYRSFGNKPVRNAPTESQAFDLLGDALAGASELSPDAIMGGQTLASAQLVGERRDAQPDAKGMDEISSWGAVAPASVPEPPPPSPPVFSQPSTVGIPSPAAAGPTAAPPGPFRGTRTELPRSERQGDSLLQILLGSAPLGLPSAAPVMPASEVPAAPRPPAVGMVPGSARPLAAPVPVSAPPVPASLAPVAAPAAYQPATPAVPSAMQVGQPTRLGGTGSSLLDALVGASATDGLSHYPLLDALGAAMRGSVAEPSPRHWPAARVDIALPELLRRVAAGVRAARTAA
jgi:hypothetical protein